MSKQLIAISNSNSNASNNGVNKVLNQTLDNKSNEKVLDVQSFIDSILLDDKL